jgi:NAD(P)-dependent dehydrogenase (short-subunit alcohol dehydrogenase family)
MMEQPRIIVIAGATSPTGHAIARRFAESGDSLALFSRDAEKLTNLSKEIGLPSSRFLTAAYDFRLAESAHQAAQTIQAHFSRCDVLINLIGGWIGGKTIEAFQTEDYATMLEQHFWTTLHLVRAFLPLLRLSNRGRVLVISSPSASLPPAKSAPYAIAKAAQETLLLSLAQELKGTSITANILRVSAIDTQGERQKEHSDQTASWVTPEEIAETIYFLCSEAANLINGARIPLYGSP